jgi:hypothetical protein
MSPEERRRALLEQISEAKAELAALGYRDEDPGRAPVALRYTSSRPLRSQVLDALDDLGMPAFTREVSQYLAAVKGDRIDPTRFGSLRAQEMKAYDGPHPRSVYIAYGLTARGEAIKRYICRSDWDLAERVVAPTTGRVQHLRMTRRLCHLALNAEEGTQTVDIDLLKLYAADHARALPGVKFQRGQFNLAAWRDLADELLMDIVEKDLAERLQIAARLNMMPARMQLFGSDKFVDPEPRLRPPITSESLG